MTPRCRLLATTAQLGSIPETKVSNETPSSPTPLAAPLLPPLVTASALRRLTPQHPPPTISAQVITLTVETAEAAELSFQTANDSLTHARWAEQQRDELLCNAAVRYLTPVSAAPSPFPMDCATACHSVTSRRPAMSSYWLPKALSTRVTRKWIFWSANPSCLRPGESGGRAARLLGNGPARLYVPPRTQPWIVEVRLSEASCHLGVARALLDIFARFYWWIGIEVGVYAVVDQSKCLKVPSTEDLAPDGSLPHSFTPLAKRAWRLRRR